MAETAEAPSVRMDPKAPIENRNTLRHLIEIYAPKIQGTLAKHMTPEKLSALAVIAVSRTPKLLECSQQSIVESIMQAGELGLDFSGNLGQGYLIPYKTKCTFIIGFRGLCDLARRSGEVVSISATMVYTNDEFDMTRGTDPGIKHRPAISGELGDVIGAYAVADLGEDRYQFEFMRIEEINAIEAKSPGARKDGSPWKDRQARPEMQKKTVIRRLCKSLPLSPDSLMQTAILHDNETDGIELSASVAEAGPKMPEAIEDATEAEPVHPGGAVRQHQDDMILGKPIKMTDADGEYWTLDIETAGNGGETHKLRTRDGARVQGIIDHADNVANRFRFGWSGKGKVLNLEKVELIDL